MVFAEETFFSGNLVILDHGYGLYSHFAHLDKIHVKLKDVLKQSMPLGTVGSTGRSTGPHLHWGMFWKETAIDPLYWVAK